jgi:hypothetical protein
MKKVLPLILALCAVGSAARYDASLSELDAYINPAWGKAFVLKNDLCTLAVMPDVGGRIMAYCLGPHSFLRVAPYASPGGLSAQDLFDGGGFMTWPAPQSIWNWPPPQYLSHGPYKATVISNSADSVVISCISQPEQWQSAAGMVFHKMYTFYKASSRVHVDVRLINRGSTPQKWSIREVAEVWPQHGALSDFSNFRAFFPKGASLQAATSGFWNTNGGYETELFSQFTLDEADGIVSFRFNNKGGRIAADPTEQWLAYQDSLEGYTFIQRGMPQPSATYPEYGGARIIIYMGAWLEMELCAPEKNIAAGDSLRFVTDWYAVKLAGAVRAINDAGAIKDSLAVNTTSNTITGSYGVFYQGTVKIMLDGQAAPAREIPVSPLTTFAPDETIDIPPTSGTISLLLYDSEGTLIDTLDSKTFRTVAAMHTVSKQMPPGFSVRVLNRKLQVAVSGSDAAKVRLISLTGKTVAEAAYTRNRGKTIDLSPLAPGSYLVTVETASGHYCCRLPVLAR